MKPVKDLVPDEELFHVIDRLRTKLKPIHVDVLVDGNRLTLVLHDRGFERRLELVMLAVDSGEVE